MKRFERMEIRDPWNFAGAIKTVQNRVDVLGQYPAETTNQDVICELDVSKCELIAELEHFGVAHPFGPTRRYGEIAVRIAE